MKVSLKYLAIIILSCSGIDFSRAQSLNQVNKLKEKYINQDALILKQTEHISITIIDCDLAINSDHYKETVFFTDKKGYMADEVIFYNNFSEINDLRAIYLFPKRNKYKRVNVENILTHDYYDNTVFYDDTKQKKIIFPKIHEGSKTIVSYKEKINEPRLLGPFYFSSYFPVKESELSITFPKDVNVRFRTYNNNKNNVSLDIKTENEKTTYTFSANDVDKIPMHNNDFPLSYSEPHVIFYIDNYSACGEDHAVLPEVSQLHKWYYSLTKDINIEESTELLHFADSLTKGLTSNLEKARRIYYWVQENIKYVAFEDGYSGFVPRPAHSVFRKRYGDCKDMASLISELLKLTGIPAYLAWIGTRDIPYSYNLLPTPVVDNHMIAYAYIEGKPYFLDGTYPFVGIDYPSEFIQGKETLISKGENEFEILKVPIVEKEKNILNDVTRIWLDDDKIQGTSACTFSGYLKAGITEGIKNSSNKELKDFIYRQFSKGNNKCVFDTVEINEIESHEKAMRVDYSFTIDAYVKYINNNIYLNLNLEKPLLNDFIEPPANVGKKVGYKYIKTYNTILEIPDRAEIVHIPANASFSSDGFGFEIKYQVHGAEIQLTSSIFVDTLIIEKEIIEDWNNMIKQLNDAYHNAIVLSKK